MVTLDAILDEATKNNRVCPQPQKWQALYYLLPGTTRVGGGYQPAAPLILASWWGTPPKQKMNRLREHIEWAADHEGLELIHRFLVDLPESNWLHIDD